MNMKSFMRLGSIAMVAAGASVSPHRFGRPVICFDAEKGTGSGGGTAKTPEQLAEEIRGKFDDAINKTREIAEKAVAEAAENRKVSEKTKETADEALLKMNALSTQMAEVEQHIAKLARAGHPEEAKTAGDRFISAENVKNYLGGSQRGSVSVEFKEALMTTNPASAGVLVEPQRLPGIIATPDRQLVVRDLITPGRMEGNSLEYIRETGFTNNAAPVAEGARKPESTIAFESVMTSPKVIAHFLKASRQMLSDAAQLASYINGRLLYGLALKEDSQLLHGDGTGQNLHGIVPQASGYTAPFPITGATGLDVIRLAMLQAVLAEYPATGHVLNPIDWTKIETLKDDLGRYIIGNPQGTVTPSLWGLPVVQTQAMGAGKFLTGAFRMGAQVFDRWAARIEVATQNESDFVENLMTILAEERLALAVYRPECFVYGDMPA